MLWVVLAVAALLIVLLGVALVRAALCGARFAAERPRPPAVEVAQAARYAEHLSQLLQCETTSRPGDDPERVEQAFETLREQLRAFYPRVFTWLEQTYIHNAMLLRWPGADPQRKAILLMAHADVVAADGTGWRRPPFGGEVAEGCVWGRGAMDDKGSLCAILEAVEKLLAEGFVPACDVYVVSSDNEEVMGDGALKILELLREHGVGLEIVCDEGGQVLEQPLPGARGLYALMGVVEKGVANIRFTATSSGGHASTPPKNSPLARLAAFVNEMETHPPFPRRLSKPVEQFLTAVAPGMGFWQRVILCNRWLFAPVYLRYLAGLGERMDAMLRTTCAFTMASGSGAPNVLPQSAGVTANLRFIPHQNREQSLAAVERVARKHGLAMEVLYSFDASPPVDTEGAAFAHMRRCVQQSFPEAVPTPFTILFGTDARYYAGDCPCTLRFSPYLLTAQQLAAMHAADENLGVEALARAVAFYERVMREYR